MSENNQDTNNQDRHHQDIYVKDLGWKFMRVIDGDTIEFEIPKNPYLTDSLRKISLRLLGLDTPEKNFLAKCAQEKELGLKATNFTKDVMKLAETIELSDLQWDKYGGRVDGAITVSIRNKNKELIRINLVELLMKNKCAVPYDGGKKSSWCGSNINKASCNIDNLIF